MIAQDPMVEILEDDLLLYHQSMKRPKAGKILRYRIQ
jgi:hypothetical protein